jgi:energy-coupling factor transporter ATP-binding protein EcfA2
MALIEVESFSYTYPVGTRPALKGLNFQVEAGELVAVLGANGAGKSTLCLALAGLIPALYHGQMQGQVRVGGLDSAKAAPGQFAGRVGLVLQNPANQFSGMRYSVYEEVAFGLENLGVPRQEMERRIEWALQQTGLSELAGRSPYALSGGQQQRLALAAVLALEAPVLVLDEPAAFLDPLGGRQVFELANQLAQAGTALLVTGQHLEWAAEYASRVLVLSEGELILDGAPQEVLVSARLEEAGCGWLRYTQAAYLGSKRGMWPVERALPASLQAAAAGFKQAAGKGTD